MSAAMFDEGEPEALGVEIDCIACPSPRVDRWRWDDLTWLRCPACQSDFEILSDAERAADAAADAAWADRP